METIFACFKTLFFASILVSSCECLVIKDLQKRRISFDSHKYAPPFFVLMPDGDTPFGFFLVFFWGWIARIYDFSGKTENLKSPHSGGLKSVKIPQILRLAIFGDTGILQVINALLTAYFIENLSFFLVSPMSAKENFVLRTIVLWVFSLTIKELQSNQRFLFSTQMHTREQILRCHRLPFLIFAASSDFIVQSGIEFHFSRKIW